MENALYVTDESYVRGYRDRASLLRRMAKTFSHEGALRDLMALARQWDAIADRLEFQAKKFM